jgi:hypothetical protein
MNAIQIKERIDFYMDTTRNGRFTFLDYNKAVNDAIRKFILDQFGDEAGRNLYGFDVIEQVRDNLFTLIKTANPTVTTLTPQTTRYGSYTLNHVNTPTDYYMLVSMRAYIDGYSDYVRPTEYNKLGPLLNDSFMAPSNRLLYCLEDNTGHIIYRGSTGTLTSVDETYLKVPTVFSMGNEDLLLFPGNALTVSAIYIAVEVSVHNGVTYQPGDQFTASNTVLTSGVVILKSSTTTTDLPDKTHNRISEIAAAIMSGVISDFNRSAFVNKESKES